MARFQPPTDGRHFETRAGNLTHAHCVTNDARGLSGSAIFVDGNCKTFRTFFLFDVENIIFSRYQQYYRMMQSVHLVGEEEDELYSGFNDYNEAFDTEVKHDSVNRFGNQFELK